MKTSSRRSGGVGAKWLELLRLILRSVMSTDSRAREDEKLNAVFKIIVQCRQQGMLAIIGAHGPIRSSDPAARSGNLWRSRTGDHGVFTWRLPRVDRARVCRCDCGNVDRSGVRPAGTLSRPHRHHQLPDRVVNYRLGPVRGGDCIPDEESRLDSAQAPEELDHQFDQPHPQGQFPDYKAQDKDDYQDNKEGFHRFGVD